MTRRRTKEIVLALAATIASGLLSGCSVNSAQCVADSGIPTTERAAIEMASLNFVRQMLAGDASGASRQMTALARREVSAEQLQQVATAIRVPFATTPPIVSETYYVTDAVGTSAVCVDVSHPQGLTTVSTVTGMDQAYVLVTETVGTTDRTFTVWLAKDEGHWRVQGFSANVSRIGGRSADDLWTAAQAQRSRDPLVASFLYELAATSSNRGRYFASGLRGRIMQDFASFKWPPERSGDGPYIWNLGGRTYRISSAHAEAVEGGLALVIGHPASEWKGEAAARLEGRAFLEAFKDAHPSWKESFDSLIVRTGNPNTGLHYGTVFTKKRGYL